MTTPLAKGGNTALDGAVCRVTLTSAATGIDVSAVLLAQDGKVRGDDDLVFYNHPAQDGVSLDGQSVVVQLAAVPAAVHTVAVVASVDPELRVTHFDAASTPYALVESGTKRAEFTPPPLVHRETVAVLVELYRRGGGWKARAVGQGWDTGLAGLAADFGIVVDDPGPSAPPATPAPPAEPPARVEPVRVEAARVEPVRTGPPVTAEQPAAGEPVPAQPTVPAQPPVPLGKVALTKAGKATISMRKDDADLVVTASLEWNGGSAARRKAGADLDLYALYVPADRVTPPGKRAAKTNGAVYYRDLGSLTAPPYLALDGDSQVPGRETVTIRRPDLQGYVLLCAYSAVENGTGSFKSYGAHAVVTDGRGSTVTVPLFHNRELSYWVAIALIDFTTPGGATIRHVEKYSANHVEARPTLYSNGEFRMGTGKIEFKSM
jgi:stress response protein SCP2/uncharacterized protein involved in tellurium resistance